MSMGRGTYFVGFLVTITGAVLFSTKAVIVKSAFIHTHVDALTLLALRVILALPFYLGAAFLVSRQKDNTRLGPRHWLYVIALGLFGYYFSSLFDFIGLQYISAGLERLILFLYPSFAVLINAMVFGQKIQRRQVIALICTYTGILVAYVGEMHVDVHNPHFVLGSGLIFLCAITYAIYIAGSGYVIPKVGAVKFTAYAMMAATAGILVHYVVAGPWWKAGGQLLPPMSAGLWVHGVLLAVVATVLPTFMISGGLRRIGANNVAIISGIGPVSTILQAHWILGEKIFVAQVAGTVLVIVGVLLIGWKRGAAGEEKN